LQHPCGPMHMGDGAVARQTDAIGSALARGRLETLAADAARHALLHVEEREGEDLAWRLRLALKRGSHTSIAQLRAAILACVEAHNDRGAPFRWVKTADEILDSMRRFGLRVIHGQ
jgi:hypothetical protein